MWDFRKLLRNVNRLDLDAVFKKMWAKGEVKRYIIALNTKGESTSQLFELGEDSKGRSLGNYAPSTVEYKFNEGQRFDHITLEDTGGFYKSFKVIPLSDGFRIEADPLKDDTNLFREYGEDIVGLNKENTQLLAAFIKEDFEKELVKRLFS